MLRVHTMNARPLFVRLVCFVTLLVPLPCACAESIGLTLEIATKLGVKTTVEVGRVTSDDPLLNALGAACSSKYSADQALLAVQKEDGGFVLIPWRQISEVTLR